MPIIKWDETYSVGIEEIDAEHKTLIDMINRAFDSEKDQESTIEQLAADMRDYAFQHFATEERYMTEYGFPGNEAHKRKHGEFLSQANGESPLDAIELIKFLANWLNSHILETDKAMGLFLQEKGVK